MGSIAFLVIMGVLVCLAADLYFRLLNHWFPPDRTRPRQVESRKVREQRRHRRVMERYWSRHPFDQEIE